MSFQRVVIIALYLDRRIGRSWRLVILVALSGLACCETGLGQQPRQQKHPRATRPNWTEQDTSDIFFTDAFKEALVGERPAHLRPSAASAVVTSSDASHYRVAESATNVAGDRWSELIDPESLESAIKSLVGQLKTSVRSEVRFAGGDFKIAAQQFGYLATLLKVVSEYDREVRWQATALACCERCVRARKSCAAGSVESFEVAKRTRDEMSEMLSGTVFDRLDQPSNWDKVVERGAWMRWIEVATGDRIMQPMQSERSFTKAKESVVVDAQLLQLIGRLLAKDEMEDGLDDDYRAYCGQLESSARELWQAASDEEYQAALRAVSAMNKSCVDCHADYRG